MSFYTFDQINDLECNIIRGCVDKGFRIIKSIQSKDPNKVGVVFTAMLKKDDNRIFDITCFNSDEKYVIKLFYSVDLQQINLPDFIFYKINDYEYSDSEIETVEYINQSPLNFRYNSLNEYCHL